MGVADLAMAPGAKVRVTHETPPRYAIADILRLALGDGLCTSHVSHVVCRAKKQLDLADSGRYRFAKGKGPAPLVCTMQEAEQIVGLLGGVRAATFRATGLPQEKRRQMEDLYVMKYSFDDTAVKIGASNKTEVRRAQLQSGHNFWVEVLAIFPQKGLHEIPIHKKLEALKSNRGAGTEWFDLPAADAVGIVSKLIQELEHEAAANAPEGA